MSSSRKCMLLSVLAAIVLAPSFLKAAPFPVNRWSFNAPAGGAASGAVAVDSIGGMDGVIRGAGATWSGTQIVLPGGTNGLDDNGSAYVDLPNGLISGKTAVTFEAWFTINGDGGWARVFDFGSTADGAPNGEVTGPGNTNGGGTDGRDYLFLSAARGGNYGQQRIEFRNEDPAGGGINTFDSNVPTINGQQYHVAVTADSSNGVDTIINYWRDGVKLTDNGVAGGKVLGDINDVNNWLGRSTWLNDANMNGSFDEFRIYDEALTQQDVLDSMALGPDTIIPEPASLSLALAALGALLPFAWRRRRRA